MSRDVVRFDLGWSTERGFFDDRARPEPQLSLVATSVGNGRTMPIGRAGLGSMWSGAMMRRLLGNEFDFEMPKRQVLIPRTALWPSHIAQVRVALGALAGLERLLSMVES